MASGRLLVALELLQPLSFHVVSLTSSLGTACDEF